ncbi:MAG TPA: chemotaxis protein CheX [Smithellaceae bacterium]|nr:chemotaxis protein CheX [Smithellaceae bacterium]
MKKIQETLMTSIFNVFEKMFFVFLEPLDEDIQYDMVTSIKFTGVMKGEIKAYLSRGIVDIMAQNMLSMEPSEITDQTIEDCAKESINMIAGSFLNKLEPSQVFDLSIPDFEKKTGQFVKDSKATLSLSFDSDEQYMGVTLNLEA